MCLLSSLKQAHSILSWLGNQATTHRQHIFTDLADVVELVDTLS